MQRPKSVANSREAQGVSGIRANGHLIVPPLPIAPDHSGRNHAYLDRSNRHVLSQLHGD